ncbi:MAG: carboxypeptidase regulatory-like domain-containing protein [Desulfatitalea sp.]|nr:carboxypeptidase regulatory-like domain-containing protein [Desulfatitalea sp.]NNK01400.1 carboxypeptidase regulatory-like domain-containing protein [Desulfatitalea sp.]
MKKLTYAVWFIALVLLWGGVAGAHKVNLFAYVEGGRIFTESYFPDGRPVTGGRVLVYDSSKQLLLEGKTDPEGLFSFAIPKVDEITIVLEASMGHKTSFTLKETEVAAGK